MRQLTITLADPLPPRITDHPDRKTAAAALADWVTGTDCDPLPNQVTTAYESYSLICLAQERVIATATIEPVAAVTP